MALRFLESFDHYGTTADLAAGKWTAADGDLSSAISRTGANSFHISDGAKELVCSAFGLSEVIFGGAFYFTSIAGTNDFIAFNSSTGTAQVEIQMTGAGELEVKRGAASLGVSSGANISTDAWYYIEARMVISDTVGEAEIRVNGNTVANLTGVDTRLNADFIDNIEISGFAGNLFYLDDVYICDTAGTENNSFLGTIQVSCLFPNGDEGANDFAPTGAGATNSDRVNEDAQDGDTTYVSSETAGDKELYTLDDLPAVVDSVLGVQVTNTMRKIDAGTRIVKNLIKSGATESAAPTAGLGPNYTHIVSTHDINPDTNAAWTVADINALSAGVEIDT